MSLRIADSERQLDLAYANLQTAFAEWAGGKLDPWRSGAQEEGASFSRRDDVYLFIARSGKAISIGASLTARDQEILRVDVKRREAGTGRKRAVIVADEQEAFFLMISLEELRRQGIRDPFKRLSNAPNVKRATVAERDYVLVGPLADPKTAEAFLALAALTPGFERHIDRIGLLAGQSDAREEAEIYAISTRVATAHRVHAKVIDALFERFHAAGFHVADLSSGTIRADFAVAGPEGAIAFEIRADATLVDFLRAIGQLVLIAPSGGAFRRALVLPAPREALGAAIAPLEAAFREAGLWVLLYDFEAGKARIWTQSAPADLPRELRGLFD